MIRKRIFLLSVAMICIFAIGLIFTTGIALAEEEQPTAPSNGSSLSGSEICEQLEDPEALTSMGGATEIWLRQACDQPAREDQSLTNMPASLAPLSVLAAGTDVAVNDRSGDSGFDVTQSTTAAAINGNTDTVCVAYIDTYHGFMEEAGFVGFSRSTDDGASFDDQGAIDSTLINYGNPSLVWRETDGNFYLTALLGSYDGIGVWQSDDDCQTFDFYSYAHADALNAVDDMEIMAVDNNVTSPYYGRMYVTWKGEYNRIQLAYSDEGLNWLEGGITLSNETAYNVNSQTPWVAVGPNGDVYVSWVTLYGSIYSLPFTYDIEFARSTNGGDTFQALPLPLENALAPHDTVNSSCKNSDYDPVGQPALAGNIRYYPAPPQIVIGDDGVIHMVYSYDPDGADTGDVVDIFYRQSNDNGQTWSAELRLSDDATLTDQFFPTISINENGRVIATWYDRRNDPTNNFLYETYTRVSYDNGLTWETSEKISDVQSPVVVDSNAGLCYHGFYDQQVQDADNAYIFWSDDRNGDADVWFDKYTFPADFVLTAAPNRQDVCTMDDTSYDISLTSVSGYSDAVTLSVLGVPTGYSPTFGTNSLTPPNTTTLDLTSDSTGTAGSYILDVVGTGPTSTHTTTVELNLYEAVPGIVTLNAPADASVDVSASPAFSWTMDADAASYTLEIATDSGFSNIVHSETTDETSLVPSVYLDPGTDYWWRVTANNTCGGAISSAYSFTTIGAATILLVDHDDNNPDVTGYYTETLEALSISYDVWDVSTSGFPIEQDLAAYDTAIWYTGDTYNRATTEQEQELSNWLGQNNCLAVSSQGMLSTITAFRSQYLGLRGYSSPYPAYTNVAGDWVVFGGLGPYDMVPPFYASVKSLFTNGLSHGSFVTPEGYQAGVTVYSDAFKSTFWGFPLEGIDDLAARQEIIGAYVDWCDNGVTYGSIEGTVTDADYSWGLADATITADDGSTQVVFTTDNNGNYAGDLRTGIYTVIAEMENYQSATVTSVAIADDASTVQDFALQGSSLDFDPTIVEETVEIGEVVTVSLNLTATGPLPVDVSASAYTTLDDRVYGVYASYDPQPTMAYYKDPSVLTSIGTFNKGGSLGGDFFGDDFSKVYALGNLDDWDYTNDELLAIDTTTGAITVIATLAEIQGYGEYVSMAYDPVTNQMYLAGTLYDLWGWPASNVLSVVDVNTGEVTELGTIISSFAGNLAGLAFDGAGNLYAHDTWNAQIVSIDLDTMQSTILSQLSIYTDFNSGMDWDPVTQQMYLSLWNTDGAQLFMVDLTTGNLTLVGPMGDITPGDPAEVAFTWIAFASAPVSWAEVVPGQEMIPADDTTTFDLVLNTRSLAQLGDYEATVGISGSFVNAIDNIPVTMHVTCVDCGVLDGDVYDDYSGLPVQASIRITNTNGIDIQLSGDHYEAYVKPGLYTISSSADGYFDYSVDVTAVDGLTVTTDLPLIHQASVLEYDPTAVDVSAEIGDVVTETITVSNTGTIPMTFGVRMDSFDVPMSIRNAIVNQINGGVQPSSALDIPVIQGYGVNRPSLEENSLAWMNLATPDVLNTSSTYIPHGSVRGGDFFGNDFSTLYAFEESKLIALDTTTGEKHVIGALPAISPYRDYPGMSYDPVSGQMYILNAYESYSTPTLYTVDVQTAETTLVGEIIHPNLGSIEAIAFDDRGTLYAVDFDNDMLLTIDTDSLDVTFIGGLGVDATQYDKGMDWDSATNQLYLTLTDIATFPFIQKLYVIDVTTGAATYLGEIGMTSPGYGAAYLGGLAIASETAHWATIPGDTITVDPGTAVTFDVIFDTHSVYRAGDYLSEIVFQGSYINEVDNLPVALHLACTDCATLDGAITDADTMDPLRAHLHITGSNGFDVTLMNSDSYNLTVKPSDYNFTVERDGYQTQSATVTVTADTETTTNFAMISLATSVSFDPANLEVTLPIGEIVTQSLTITNDGNLDFDYLMLDKEVGTEITSTVPLTTCGDADGFGYSCIDSHAEGGPAYNWIDLSETGTSLGLQGANDYYFPIELPFDFSFYGEEYHQVAVSSYGQLTFQDGYPDTVYVNRSLPYTMTSGVNSFIVPYWDTINFDDWREPTTLFEIQGIAPHRRLIISWENVTARDSNWSYNPINFQVILFEGSNNILMQYAEMNGTYGDSATIGIQGDPQTALQYSYNEVSLTDNMSICFVHPDATLINCDLNYPTDVPWLIEIPDIDTIGAGETVTVDVVFNSTAVSETGTYNAEIYFGNPFSDPMIIPVTMNLYSLEWSQGQGKSAAPGESVTYEISLTNVGNIVDTYDLMIETIWPTQIGFDVGGNNPMVDFGLSVTLEPQESATLYVMVAVPQDTDGGSTDIVTITATSRWFEASSDAIQLTTTAAATTAENIVYLPLIFKSED